MPQIIFNSANAPTTKSPPPLDLPVPCFEFVSRVAIAQFGEGCRLSYSDEEGDDITLQCDGDLAEAFRIISGPLLVKVVQDIDAWTHVVSPPTASSPGTEFLPATSIPVCAGSETAPAVGNASGWQRKQWKLQKKQAKIAAKLQSLASSKGDATTIANDEASQSRFQFRGRHRGRGGRGCRGGRRGRGQQAPEKMARKQERLERQRAKIEAKLSKLAAAAAGKEAKRAQKRAFHEAKQAERETKRAEREERRAAMASVKASALQLTAATDGSTGGFPSGVTHVFLDGNNMLFITDALRKLCLSKRRATAERALADAADAFARAHPQLRQVVLLFDRTDLRLTALGGRLQVGSAAPAWPTADDLLVAWAERTTTGDGDGGDSPTIPLDLSGVLPEQCLFVTSDRGLCLRLQSLGALHCKPGEWARYSRSACMPPMYEAGGVCLDTANDFFRPFVVALLQAEE